MDNFILETPSSEIKNVLMYFKRELKLKSPWKHDENSDKYYFETVDVLIELYGGFCKNSRKRLTNKYLLNPCMGTYLRNFENDMNVKLICLGSHLSKCEAARGTTTLRWTFDDKII